MCIAIFELIDISTTVIVAHIGGSDMMAGVWISADIT